MHLQRIHFDKVFDVQPHVGLFSFASAGKPTYGVNLRDCTIPNEGATWIVAFSKPGDWSTLLGWRDLAAGRTTLTYQVRDLLFDEAWAVYWFAIPALALSLYFGGAWAAALLSVGALAGGAWLLRHIVRRNRQLRAALRKA